MLHYGYEMGLSSSAIAHGGKDHPHDPSDLLRCIRYCERSGLSTQDLRKRMAGRSPQWDRLLPEWDRLVALLEQEMSTATDHRAPLTYIEMKVILSGGVRCDACGGSGRGMTCTKCNGSGRRNGGQCRASMCARGAHPCVPCRGYGYTTRTAVA